MPEKLLEIFHLRISETLSYNIGKLNKQEHDQMLAEVRDLMARHVHNSEAIFNPKIYQDDEEVK